MAGTTKKKIDKNSWNAMNGIVTEKGLYNQAKATGGDYLQHYKNAAEHYGHLRDNGMGDVADAFMNVDYDGALKILDQYEAENTYDEYLKAVSGAPSRQNSAGLDPTTNQWQGTAGKLMEGAQKPQVSDTAQKMYDSYYQLENVLNGPITKDANGNVVSGLNVDHYNSGKGQLDYLQNFDVTAQPYFKGIMEQYKLLGGDAAQGELAGGAAGNSGNIDSFSRANANRQQLAFTTAGIDQALAAANQNQSNWQNVFDRMTVHLANMGDQNAQKLVEAGKVYETDSKERQNALNEAAATARQEMQNNMDWYLGLLDYDKTMDALNKEVAAEMYGVDVGAETDKYISDSTNETNKYIADKELDGTKYIADKELDGTKYVADKELDGTKYVADKELDGTKYVVDKELDGTKYVADKDAEAAAESEATANAEKEKLVKLDTAASNAVRAWLSGTGPYASRDAIVSALQQKFPDVAASTIDSYISAAETAYRGNQTGDMYRNAKGIALDVVRRARQGEIEGGDSAETLYKYIREEYTKMYGNNISDDVIHAALTDAVASWSQFDPVKTATTGDISSQFSENTWNELIDIFSEYYRNNISYTEALRMADEIAGVEQSDALVAFNYIGEQFPTK